jgi:hypothetical protein
MNLKSSSNKLVYDRILSSAIIVAEAHLPVIQLTKLVYQMNQVAHRLFDMWLRLTIRDTALTYKRG